MASAQVIKSGIAADTWYHVAVSREGSSIRLFCNGVLTTTVTFSSALMALGANTPSIGQWAQSSWLNGFVDDFHPKGKAQYVGNFTPPTVPHYTVQDGDPYWNNVVLGCHFNGGETPTFKDVSAGKTITAYGNAAISSTQSKFGYSAYFDGTGDYLSLAHTPDLSFGAVGTDFTIELFIRPSAFGAQQNIVNKQATLATDTGYLLPLSPTGAPSFYAGTRQTVGTCPWSVEQFVRKHLVSLGGHKARLDVPLVCRRDSGSDNNLKHNHPRQRQQPLHRYKHRWVKPRR